MARVILKVTQLDDRSLETMIDVEPSTRPENVGLLLADIARHFERYFEKRGRGAFLAVITDYLLRELDNPTSPIEEKPEVH